jgi:UDPglucose--hexose-1-phosphate uridylyltransferase
VNLENQPHRRLNPLNGEWVLVSPHRAQRPWQGKREAPAQSGLPAHDPACYLCPGSTRAGGHVNPDYDGVYVFDNDFPALLSAVESEPDAGGGLLTARAEHGVCRVLCFSPRHDLTLSRMDGPGVRAVVDAWVEQDRELGERPELRYVQIFENRGEQMGCSNPHPHAQIWASGTVPQEPDRELTQQRRYWDSHRSPLLADYLKLELEHAERAVCSNEHFLAVVPFWAVWPFETLLLPRRAFAGWSDMSKAERDGLADILRRLCVRYDNLFETPFPYSMGFHPAPCDGEPHPEWVFHAHFYPPLLRSASVRKFMVGFEMLGMPQRDITAEQAASRLRAAGERHYLDSGTA